MQRAFVLVLLALLACSALAQLEEAQFKEFMVKHGKSYNNEEFLARFNIFKANLARIDELNKKATGARYGVTKFADLTPAEFKAQYLGKLPRAAKPDAPLLKVKEDIEVPSSFDWRDKGAVTGVKDQGQCGSCWAFSATEAIESQWFLSKGKLLELSEQQIVDCDKGRGDYGCSGGDTPTAYEYVISASGLETESSYPYTAEDGQCSFNKASVAASISSWKYATKTKNETEMMAALVSGGPLSICVEADSWQYYVGGVISSMCGQDLDHCVMISGYGTKQGWDFANYNVWYIRNSWGTGWGYGGYLYVERGYNLCGVAEEVTLPIV